MTKKEAMRQSHQEDTLLALGFTREEAESLRRISMTLNRWHERECGNEFGCIEREEGTDKPFWRRADGERGYDMPDREKGALKRLTSIVEARNEREDAPFPLGYYIQTDPRGAALYILRPGDVPAGQDPGAHYSRGICVY